MMKKKISVTKSFKVSLFQNFLSREKNCFEIDSYSNIDNKTFFYERSNFLRHGISLRTVVITLAHTYTLTHTHTHTQTDTPTRTHAPWSLLQSNKKHLQLGNSCNAADHRIEFKKDSGEGKKTLTRMRSSPKQILGPRTDLNPRTLTLLLETLKACQLILRCNGASAG